MTEKQQPASVPGEVTFEIKTIHNAVSSAPVIHIDGAQSFLAAGGLVKFNLVEDLLMSGLPSGPPGEPFNRTICARLVMTTEVFLQLATWLQEKAAKLAQPSGQPEA